MAEDAGYPPELVADVLKGLRADLVRDGYLGALEAGPPVEGSGVLASAAKGRRVQGRPVPCDGRGARRRGRRAREGGGYAVHACALGV